MVIKVSGLELALLKEALERMPEMDWHALSRVRGTRFDPDRLREGIAELEGRKEKLLKRLTEMHRAKQEWLRKNPRPGGVKEMD